MSQSGFFKLVHGYNDVFLLPKRATKNSAGYDFVVAEDTVVPSYLKFVQRIDKELPSTLFTINEVTDFTKQTHFKPTLVPTGVKAYIPEDQYLQLSVRSSCPLKNWLILANGVGIIDADYYNNPDNEGHIYFHRIFFSKKVIRLDRAFFSVITQLKMIMSIHNALEDSEARQNENFSIRSGQSYYWMGNF